MRRYMLPQEHELHAAYRLDRRAWAEAIGRPIKKLKRFHLPPVIPDDAEAEALNVPDE